MTRANAACSSGSASVDPDVRVSRSRTCSSRSARSARPPPDVNVQYTRRRAAAFPDGDVGDRRRDAAGTRRAASIQRPSGCRSREIAAARADLVGRARRDRKLEHGRSRGRHVHDLEPRHVRRRPVRRRAQPAAGCDPRRRRDRGAVVVRDGEVVVRPMMTMTLTFDHRAVGRRAGGGVPADRQGAPRGPGARAC